MNKIKEQLIKKIPTFIERPNLGTDNFVIHEEPRPISLLTLKMESQVMQ